MALREPHRTPGTGTSQSDSPQLLPSSPTEFWATVSLSKAYCYYKRLAEPPKCAEQKSKKKTPSSPNVGSRRWIGQKWLRTLPWKTKKERQTDSYTEFKINLDQQMLPPKQTPRCRRVCLKCYTFFHFKCLLYIQQDSLRLEKCDSENSRNKRFWKC